MRWHDSRHFRKSSIFSVKPDPVYGLIHNQKMLDSSNCLFSELILINSLRSTSSRLTMNWGDLLLEMDYIPQTHPSNTDPWPNVSKSARLLSRLKNMRGRSINYIRRGVKFREGIQKHLGNTSQRLGLYQFCNFCSDSRKFIQSFVVISRSFHKLNVFQTIHICLLLILYRIQIKQH